MARIFISHSSIDNAHAIALRDWLVAEGWNDLFLDLDPERGIAAGERWERALNEAARRCEAVLFLISEAWMASRWCINELILARRLNKRMFGVLIEEGQSAGDLPPDVTSTWQVVNLATGRDHDQFRVTLPVTGEELHITFSREGLARLKIGLQRAGLHASYFDWPPEHDPFRPPYRGMKPLEADDAGIFFGREAPIIEAIDRLRGLRDMAPPRMFVVVGASGAGKSSFLRAGLLPRLARDDATFFPLPVMRPERAAITGETGLLNCLTGAFQAANLKTARAELRAAIDGGAPTLAPYLSKLTHAVRPPVLDGDPPRKPPALVLAIDQGEELFVADAQVEARTLLRLLSDLAAVDSPALIAVVTIRSDNYERLQSADELEAIPKVPFDLGPMPIGSYAEIIRGPLRRLDGTSRALKLEESLVDALLADIEDGGSKDALPLLAFTLGRLYEEFHATGDLRLDHYDRLGRIKGSIEAAVQRAFKQSDKDPRIPGDRQARLTLLRRGLIPWLAGIDPDTGAPRRNIARASEIPAEARPLIDLLVDQHLLVADIRTDTKEQTIQPAHEALLRQWSVLQGWLTEDAGQLTVLDGVKRAARDWVASGRSVSWLSHNADRLESAERLSERSDLAASFEPHDTQYLAACRNADNAAQHERQAQLAVRARAQRIARLAVFGIFGLAIIVFLSALWQIRLATERETRVLISLADRAIREGHHDHAMRIALHGLPSAGSIPWFHPLSSELRKRLSKAAIASRLIAEFKGRKPTFTKDGRRIVTSSKDFLALWDSESGRQLAILQGHFEDGTEVALSPDHKQLLTVSKNGTAHLWDVATGKQIAILKGNEGRVTGGLFSPDGRRILTRSDDNTARLWDAKSGGQIAAIGEYQDKDDKSFLDDDPRRILHFSPDGKRAIVRTHENALLLLDSDTGKQVAGLVGHEDQLVRARFSHDSKRFLTVSKDKTARLWITETGEEAAILKGHDGTVTNGWFSPDSMRLVTSSEDKTARLWDGRNGALMAVFKGHENTPDAVFSPSGSRIVTFGTWTFFGDKTATLWDGQTGAEIAVLKGHEGGNFTIHFNSDGTRILSISGEPGDPTARLWDARTGSAVAILRHGADTSGGTFNSDGQLILTWSEDHTARLWAAADGREIVVLNHDGPISNAEFSPDESWILTSSHDKTARLWNAKTGSELISLKGHTTAVINAIFSPDGQKIITSTDEAVRLWASSGGKVLRQPEGTDQAATGAIFSRDGARILTISKDNTATLRDSASLVLIGVMTHYDQPEGSCGCSHDNILTFSPDGKRLLTRTQDNTLTLWDGETGAQLALLKGHTEQLKRATFTLDGKRILTVSKDKTARLWDGITGKPIAILHGQDSEIFDALFSSDGKRVLVRTEATSAHLWDGETGALIAVLKGHESEINTTLFSPDSKRILTVSKDKTGRLWDSENGTATAVLKGHDAPIVDALFNPVGSIIVTISEDKTARLWDATNGAEHAVIREQEERPIIFSPDGKTLLSLSGHRIARLWDAITGTQIATLETDGTAASFSPNEKRILVRGTRISILFDGTTGSLIAKLIDDPMTGYEGKGGWSWYGDYAAHFSPDSKHILTRSTSRSTRIWDSESGEALAVLEGHERQVTSASFSPDGKRVLTASADKTARLWDISWIGHASFDELRARVCAERLPGAQVFTDEDASDPILAGLAGNNPCDRHSAVSLGYWSNFFRNLRPK